MPNTSTLGILAGQGELPAKLIADCKAKNRPCFVLSFEGNIADETLKSTPHAVIRFSAIGAGLEHLRSAGVKQLVMAGNMKRPPLSQLKPEDAVGAKLLKRLGKAFFGGDDALLKALVAFLEDEGFEVIGVDSLLGGLTVPAGNVGKINPTSDQLQDIAKGFAHLLKIGTCDIGQALVIENGYVLGVEAAEGTDALVDRCAELMKERGKAILVKGKKPEQETRADMPTIGEHTIALLAKHEYAGVAIQADATLIIDLDKVQNMADKKCMFVYAHAVSDV